MPYSTTSAQENTYSVGLLETSVVCNILSLSHPAVDKLINLVQLVAVVLIDEALGTFPKLSYGRIVPPLHHITVLVKLPTCKIIS